MQSLRHRLRHWTGRADAFAPEPGLEAIYRDLFLRELKLLGEEDRFFPTGGAANYSLLYLILRIGADFRPTSVLDVGAGQSSLLWAMLQRRGLVGEVLTLENDPDWGERIAAQVTHEVLVTPLASRTVGKREVTTYDWSAARAGRRFDVVLCDGPRGTPRHSRGGVLAMLDDLPHDFALILDDAERDGEQDTVGAIHARLQADRVDYGVGVVRAAKTQVLFAGGRFLPATFL
ncbi:MULTISPECIES: hypothetical protein [Sphingomonas]|jgi:hypothetical protein|uniref:Class I SAM-dependent methyltransferase n=1 Tax=Sphingomonas zeae TaxID=1646122 RepID=A0A7Y6B657_9SPHN|nr:MULTISPECIES: hypothetical protein [Sphingomonas]MBB4048640.1 hypothetical protein [Sphingomonas zeae]MDK8186466.1 hypothetical protein [Sphingomonas zeae]MDK8216125.1 hypothetical protein [Sphingomonas sp. UMB7805-LC452B]NUU47928.1 hypothetical protein [Sphingomonas zeae]